MEITVHMLPAEAGGRRGPTPADSYGCIVIIDGVNLDVRFRLGDDGPLQPGSARDVDLFFVNPDFASPHVQPGMRFQLREKSVIGTGRVKQVFIGQRQRRHA